MTRKLLTLKTRRRSLTTAFWSVADPQRQVPAENMQVSFAFLTSNQVIPWRKTATDV